VKVSSPFALNEVVYNYNGTLLSYKDGKETYKVTTDPKGYMFLLKFRGTSIWRDATYKYRVPVVSSTTQDITLM